MHYSIKFIPRSISYAVKYNKHANRLSPDSTFEGKPGDDISVGKAEIRSYHKRIEHASNGELHDALMSYLSLPDAISNSRVGWETLLLSLLSLSLDLVFPQLPCAPLMLIDDRNAVPPFLATLANIHNIYPIISGSHGKIKRPSVLSAYIPLGASAPSNDLTDYVGGKVKTTQHGKLKVWLPLCRQPVIVAPNFPDKLFEQILGESPLAMFILVGHKIPKRHSLTLRYKSADFDCCGRMPHINVKLLRIQLAMFDDWVHSKKRYGTKLLNGMNAFLPGGFCGRFSSTSAGDSLAVLLALALSTLRLFLKFCFEFGWISDAEAEIAFNAAWIAVLPESSPTPPAEAAAAIPPDWANADTFWSFIAEYLGDGQDISIHAKGISTTKALISAPQGDDLLIFPREKTCAAYRSFLERAGSGSPRNGFELKLVHTITERWNVHLQTEGNNISWRFQFYKPGQAPTDCKEKLPCLGFPVNQLPESIWRFLPPDTSPGDSKISVIPKSHSEAEEGEENA